MNTCAKFHGNRCLKVRDSSLWTTKRRIFVTISHSRLVSIAAVARVGKQYVHTPDVQFRRNKNTRVTFGP